MRAWKKTVLSLTLAAGVAVGGTAEAMTSDEEQQLDVLSAQSQIWEKNMSIEEAIAQDGKFAVTDLDHNGRMELLFTTTVGEEEFVETWGYEVNEKGDGVSRLTLEKCDRTISLPMKGHIGSLNASVAAGILMYEIVRQRSR